MKIRKFFLPNWSWARQPLSSARSTLLYPFQMLNAKQGSSNSHLLTSFGMTRPGIEPTTSRLWGGRSTDWANTIRYPGYDVVGSVSIGREIWLRWDVRRSAGFYETWIVRLRLFFPLHFFGGAANSHISLFCCRCRNPIQFPLILSGFLSFFSTLEYKAFLVCLESKHMLARV